MPKVMQKGKLNDKSRSRVSDMLISLLATLSICFSLG